MRFFFALPVIWGLFLSLPPLLADDGDRATPSHRVQIEQAGELVLRGFPQIDSPFVTVRLDQGPMRKMGDADHFGGIDVEILLHLAERLGVELKIRPIAKPELRLLLDDLGNGEGDISGGGLTITPERRQKVLFSRPYVSFHSVALVPMDRRPTRADLSSMRLTVLRGSSFDEKLTQLGLPETRLHRGAFNMDGLERLAEGHSDMVFFDSCALPEGVGHSLRAAFRFAELEHLGYALPKGSDLKPELDAVLDALEASGELQKILDRSLRSIDATTLPVIQAEDFCGDDCRPIR